MVSFVLVIPKHTLNAMLITWLSLKDVGKLDAALCDSSCRDVFEHSLALRKLSKVSDALYSNLCFIRWALKRKVKFGAWCIQGDLLRSKHENLRYRLLQSVGPTLRFAVVNFRKGMTDIDNFNTSEDLDSDSSVGNVRLATSRTQDVNYAEEIKLMDESIADLTLRCTNLKVLRVIGRHTGSVLPLLQMNPNLRSVTLTSCPKVLRCIKDLCPNITSIKIAEQASSTDLELFALNIPPKLTQLCLPDSNAGSCFLSHVFSCAPFLLELRLGSVSCDWADLQIICVNLVVFRCIVPPRALRNELITNLSNVMPHARTLILLCSHSVSQDVVATTITNILVGFQELIQLCLQRAFEDKIPTIPSKYSPVQPQTVQTHPPDSYLLEELYLDTIGHSLFRSTIQNCPALHTLGLSSATDSSTIMKHLPASVTRFICVSLHCAEARGYAIFKNLRELEIGNCELLTDSELIHIVKNCPQLTLLHIYYAPRVTLKGVLTVLKLCPQLRSLESTRARENRKNKNDEAVAAMMELCLLHYPKLQHISVMD